MGEGGAIEPLHCVKWGFTLGLNEDGTPDLDVIRPEAGDHGIHSSFIFAIFGMRLKATFGRLMHKPQRRAELANWTVDWVTGNR